MELMDIITAALQIRATKRHDTVNIKLFDHADNVHFDERISISEWKGLTQFARLILGADKRIKDNV